MKETKYKCPTCKGKMWMDYESGSWGKDYFYKCSKKKHHNPNCQDKNKYWECDKCEKPSFLCQCVKLTTTLEEFRYKAIECANKTTTTTV